MPAADGYPSFFVKAHKIFQLKALGLAPAGEIKLCVNSSDECIRTAGSVALLPIVLRTNHPEQEGPGRSANLT